ncbi:hypothetical protein [Klebsiella variicola]|uniref:hypothetical protein n=1 Tax=Klebsiella variicola TaxID=244366 RepID=UPI002B05433B|nr:hypothetical protein [Klebsiella variicola]HBW0877972.1 hypothetical protein [Klebsiella variicola]HBW0890073.1 hypothetical protein [Klebsiella variicola]
MTDITELAQREKFEAWAEEVGALPWGMLKKHRNKDGNYPGPHYTYMWKAWQAASAELVEALEKAQTKAIEQGRTACELFDEVTALRQRIAELESRAVTVENLQESAYRAGLTAGWNLGLANNNDGFNKCLAAHAAGIKVEAE